jgi:hypothetical protein
MKPGFRQLDANAHESLTRFHNRTGWEPVDSRMPFAEMVEREDDGSEQPAGEYEFRQRMIGIRALFRFVKKTGVHPAEMLKWLAAAGRACNEEPFSTMTMGEAGQLFSETKAAHSWRCKILSKEIELTGLRGSKLPGQKSKEASASYRKIRKGNKNRTGGTNGKHKPRQGSFLKKLHVSNIKNNTSNEEKS